MTAAILPRSVAKILAATIACGALAVSACTGTTPQPPIDSAILSVEDVRGIADFPELDAESGPPSDQPQPDPTAPDPCKAVLDQQVIFGDGVSQFRTVTYSAATDTGPGQVRGVAIVSQALGRYPDAEAAQAAFDKLAPEVRECSALGVKNYEYDVVTADSSTLNLRSNVADVVFRVQSSDLAAVVVVGMPDSDRIASDVAQAMADRLV